MDLPVISDVSRTWEVKQAALAAHALQPIRDHFGPMAQALAQLHGRRIERPYAEAFRAVPLLGRLPSSTVPLRNHAALVRLADVTGCFGRGCGPYWAIRPVR